MCEVRKDRPPKRWNSSFIEGVFYGVGMTLVALAVISFLGVGVQRHEDPAYSTASTVYQVPPRSEPLTIKASKRSSVHLSPQLGVGQRSQRDPRASAVRTEPRAQERYREALTCENNLRKKDESLIRLRNYIPFSLQGRYSSLQSRVREVLLSPPSETAEREILLSRQQDEIVSTSGLSLSNPLFIRLYGERAGLAYETERRTLVMNQIRGEVNSFEEELISQNINQPPL